jgi:hypothetical protein
MLLTVEPTNGYGHHGCGMCPAWFQAPAELRDAVGDVVLHSETGQPVIENDQEVSGRELWEHIEDQHPSQPE